MQRLCLPMQRWCSVCMLWCGVRHAFSAIQYSCFDIELHAWVSWPWDGKPLYKTWAPSHLYPVTSLLIGEDPRSRFASQGDGVQKSVRRRPADDRKSRQPSNYIVRNWWNISQARLSNSHAREKLQGVTGHTVTAGMKACTKRSVLLWVIYFLTLPMLRSARDAWRQATESWFESPDSRQLLYGLPGFSLGLACTIGSRKTCYKRRKHIKLHIHETQSFEAG